MHAEQKLPLQLECSEAASVPYHDPVLKYRLRDH